MAYSQFTGDKKWEITGARFVHGDGGSIMGGKSWKMKVLAGKIIGQVWGKVWEIPVA